MNRSYQAYYKWANYTTYAKLTETNIKKMNSIRAAIDVT